MFEILFDIVCLFRILVERILNTSLVPFSLDPTDRMKRLYILYGNIDDHATKLVIISGLNYQLCKSVRYFLGSYCFCFL